MKTRLVAEQFLFHADTKLRDGQTDINMLMFIGPCIIAIVEEWKTNLMSLAILFHLFSAQHVSDINISIISSLRLCWWITTSVVLFCKDGCFSIIVTLRCVVVCLVWCVLSPCCSCRCILIDFDRYLLCFVTSVFVCVWYFSLVVWYLVPCWCNLLCEFEIVHTSVRCVLELLLRLVFGGVRFAGWSTTVLFMWHVGAVC